MSQAKLEPRKKSAARIIRPALVAGLAVLISTAAPIQAGAVYAESTATADETDKTTASQVDANQLDNGSEEALERSESALMQAICEPDYVYSVTQDGSLIEIQPDGTLVPLGSWTSDPAPESGFNLLGITPDGSTTYAAGRYGEFGGNQGFRVFRYTESGGFEQVSDFLPVDDNASFFAVAGAVDPVTGNYLMGSSVADPARYRLFEWDPDSPDELQSIGHVDRGFPFGTGNGDFAFDLQGNLHMVSHQTNSADAYITSISAADMDELRANTDPNATAPATSTVVVSDLDPVPTQVNGIAYDGDGGLYLGTTNDVLLIDPTSGDVISEYATDLVSSRDLASCNFPTTLTVQKDVVGRANAGDQFELNLFHVTDGVQVANTVTEGTELGIQDQQIGPVTVLAGTTFEISEVGAAGANLANYDSSYTCTIDDDPLTSGAGTVFELEVPSDRPGAEIVCVFTNEPLDPELGVSKSVSGASGSPEGTAVPGDVLTYELEFTSTGTATADVVHIDNLVDVLEHATWNDNITVDPDSGLDVVFDPDLQVLFIDGQIDPSNTVTVTYQVTVNTDAPSGETLINLVTTYDPQDPPTEQPDPPTECDPEVEICTETPVAVGDLNVAKTSNPKSGTELTSGDTVEYTLTFTNDGSAAVDVDYTDLLAGVVDDATWDGEVTSSDPSLTVTTGEDSFRVTGSLAPDTTVTITYSVKVNGPGYGDDVLLNFVVVTGKDAPKKCVKDSPLCTEHPVGEDEEAPGYPTEPTPDGKEAKVPGKGILPKTGPGLLSVFAVVGLVLVLAGLGLVTVTRLRRAAEVSRGGDLG